LISLVIFGGKLGQLIAVDVKAGQVGQLVDLERQACQLIEADVEAGQVGQLGDFGRGKLVS
jgi:predicted Holliday junction resolvase-like endonuclease